MGLSVDPIRPYLATARWAAAVILVMAWAWFWHGQGAAKWEGKFNTEKAAHQAALKAHAAVLDGLAKATAETAAKARAAALALAHDRTDNDDRYDKKVDDAKQARNDLAAALRRGDVQLQPWWQCGAAPGSNPGAAAALAEGEDAAADLRAADTAATVEDADHADAWIGWLQDELTSTRRQAVAAGCAVEPQP
ncbi:hypothetical protein I5U77_01965 [Stenotrophomonas maltophilia]|nr:hypothetical protein [Stenotrophomonas maltophilia]